MHLRPLGFFSFQLCRIEFGRVLCEIAFDSIMNLCFFVLFHKLFLGLSEILLLPNFEIVGINVELGLHSILIS